MSMRVGIIETLHRHALQRNNSARKPLVVVLPEKVGVFTSPLPPPPPHQPPPTTHSHHKRVREMHADHHQKEPCTPPKKEKKKNGPTHPKKNTPFPFTIPARKSRKAGPSSRRSTRVANSPHPNLCGVGYYWALNPADPPPPAPPRVSAAAAPPPGHFFVVPSPPIGGQTRPRPIQKLEEILAPHEPFFSHVG